MIRKQKILRELLALLMAILVGFGCVALLSIHQCRTELAFTHYTLETQLRQSIRIVQLTDLHSHLFGQDNELLVQAVLDQKPDMIVMTGDMMDKTDTDAGVVCGLIRSLSREIPVWYCYGNHEISWMETNGASLKETLEEAGAIVLDRNYQDITVNGQPIRISGFHGYYRYWGMYTSSPEQWESEEAYASSFEDTNRFTLLLNHIPTGWLDWKGIDSFPVDLVLTGHYHGGQIRLPLLGGLFAPYVGFFPMYTDGLFAGQKAVCVLSKGLGSSPGIPRINNLPEITVIDLVPQK